MAEFPRADNLKRGAILGAIANSVMVLECPEYEYFRTWDGNNYVVSPTDGNRGAITFEANAIVGLFFDPHSKYNPLGANRSFDVTLFLRGMQEDHRRVAEQVTMRYFIQDYQGTSMPIITSAFWDEHGQLAGAESWNSIFQNGARIVQIELMVDLDEALEEWQDAYQMSKPQLEMAKTLFKKRMASIDDSVYLSESDSAELKKRCSIPENLIACQRSLGRIGIHLI